jgi:hypothetical protein
MSWAIVIAAGATVVGGVVSSQGAKKAGDKAAEGSQAAIAEQRRQFDTIRGDTANYRAIGNQAINTLGSIYGYKPASSYFPSGPSGATPYSATVNTGSPGNALLARAADPKTAIRGALDPLGASIDSFKFFGGLFGSKKGDEKRNLNAFFQDNKVYDLGNGMLSLEDGTQFPKEKLEEIAGNWYGATYAPDGDQAGWQQRYESLIAPFRPQQEQQAASPFGQPGGQGNALSGPDYSAFFASPDYNFRRNEGMRGIEQTAAARGGAASGNALKALADFNSNLAAGEFGNYFNRQAALAGIGQTATNTSAQAGLSTGANIGNALIEGSNARASGIAGQYNAIGAGLSGIGQAAGYWHANRGGASGYGGYGSQAMNWGYGPPRGMYG